MKVRTVSTGEFKDALDPNASVWKKGAAELVKLMPTPLGMQPTEIIRETWKNRSYGITPEVRVRAIRDEATLAFHLEWSDPSKDDVIEDNDQFPDGAAIMLPVVPDAPMITMGWEEGPVEIWYWRADEAEGHARQIIGKGIGTSETISRDTVRANARWENGTWRVVLMRDMKNDSEVKTAQLEPNGSTNFGVAIWQGSNAERAGLKAFSIEWRELGTPVLVPDHTSFEGKAQRKMEKFVHESKIAASPQQVVSMLDELSFLDLVAERDNHILCVERPIFEKNESGRHKMLRVFPNLHLPKWVEQRIHNHEPHLDIHYSLSKSDLVERVWCESRLGTLEGKIHYLATGEAWTQRRAVGVITCEKPLIGGFIERLFLKNILGIQELEASILGERFGRQETRNIPTDYATPETAEL